MENRSAYIKANLRRVLIVSLHFPPSTLAGVHRARHLVKHLPTAGWRPIILCVDESQHEEPLDPELAGLLPKEFDIMKVGAWPAPLTRLVGIGDIGLRAFLHLRAGLRKAITAYKPDVVFFTGSPFYPMLLARMAKKQYGLPVVLDFQDPWVSSWGEGQRLFSKSGLSHALAKKLEPVAVRNADFITSVSETQNAQLVERYPSLDKARLAAIPIGGDPDDYVFLRTNSVLHPEVTLPPAKINFTYVGTFMPRSGPVVEQLFKALAKLKTSDPALATRLRVNFIGTSNQPGGIGRHVVRPIAEALNVADLVSETPQRVPYLEALGLLANSNAILLLGSDEPHYTASKIYPALLSGRPSLAVFHKSSNAFDILSRCGGARVLGFENSDQLGTLSDDLVQALRDLALRPEILGAVQKSFLAPYKASNVARRFALIFDSLLAGS
jgi:hypothetical protein